MAGFGFSPQDIVQGIALAKRIFEVHFERERRAGRLKAFSLERQTFEAPRSGLAGGGEKARLRRSFAPTNPHNTPFTARARHANAFLFKDARYAQFGIEIGSLRNVLELLKVKLSDAGEKYEEQRNQRWGTALCDPKDHGLEAERRNLVGDFQSTLRQCETILAEHSSYLRNPTSFRQNVLWEFRIQEKIDKLVNRIQFHISKVTLVTEQLQDGLLRNMAVTLDRIDRNVADIHNVVVTRSLQPSMPAITPVPEALAKCFNEALMAPHRPLSFTDPRQLPILEGFDALAYHFFQSTVRSHGPPGSAQPLEQYINLVKAQWLVQVLKNTTQFEQSFYYKRATLRMEQLISDEKGRSDLTRYSEADFELVNATSYAIWVADEVDPGPINDDGPGSEEQILELPMRDAPEALTVFRMSDTELRLVRPTASSGTGLPPRDRESEINVHSHHFEPVYASPLSLEPTNQVKISSSQVRSARLYDLKEIGHVYELQRAVTGFKVVHDRINVQWTLNRKGKSGEARIQIWQFKPLSQANANVSQSSPNSPSDKSTYSGFSTATNQTVAESLTEGLNPAIFSIVRNSAAKNGNESENIILEQVPLPLLVMFTVFEEQRAFFQLELESGIRINPDSCRCRDTRDTCLQVVIENRPPSRSSFKLSVLSENQNISTPKPWDLSVLGLPRHPRFKERVKSLGITYLALTFSSLSDKERFVEAFNTISRLRNRDELDYLEARARFARRANRPNANESARKPSNAIFSLSKASTAPTIGNISLGSNLQDGLAYLTDTR